MWSASKVDPDFADKIQINAGTLLSSFDVSNPAEPSDSAIICATSGDFSITCQPETSDFFEDVNNVPNGSKEGLRITGWNCSLSVNALDVTADTLKLALGAADTTAASGLTAPRAQYVAADFRDLYWIGDMADDTKLFVVKMENTIGGGISFTASKNNKGGMSLELSAHPSIANPDKVPMEFYILTKSAGTDAASPEPSSTEP